MIAFVEFETGKLVGKMMDYYWDDLTYDDGELKKIKIKMVVR